MATYQPIAERLVDAIEDYDLDPVSELVCGILQVFSIEDKMVEDDKRIFVFDDHSGAVLSPSSGLAATDVQYVVEIEDDDDDDDDEDDDEDEQEESE